MHYLWQTPRNLNKISHLPVNTFYPWGQKTEMSEEIGHWWDQVNPIILSNNLFSHDALKHAHLKEYTQDHRVNFPAVIRKVISPDKEGKYILLHRLLFMTTVIPRRTRDPEEEEDVGIPHYTSRACHMYWFTITVKYTLIAASFFYAITLH